MKIYYTLKEGEEWREDIVSRKSINTILRMNSKRNPNNIDMPLIKAIRIGKSPIIYDFVLLKLRKQPWIRNLPNGTR